MRGAARREAMRMSKARRVFIRTLYAVSRLSRNSFPARFSQLYPSARLARRTSSAKIAIPRRSAPGSALYVTRMHWEA